MKPRTHPVSKYGERPFRLWDPKLKQNLARRYFSDPKRAHDRALELVRWSMPGYMIEVYSARNGRLLGVYYRQPAGVRFTQVNI